MGLVNDHGTSVERNLIDPHIHSEKLLTLIDQVLTQAKTNLRDVSAIAVSIGPGSFTGLRIGLSTAKGLCYALGCPLIAIPTFDGVVAAAGQSRPKSQSVFVAVDAKQGEFYFGSTDSKDSHGSTTVPVETKKLEHLPKNGVSAINACWITDRPDVVQSLGVREELITSYSSFCKGDVVARLGIEKVLKSDLADLASIEPMYLKDFLVKTSTA